MILGIDAGTSAVKLAVLDGERQVVLFFVGPVKMKWIARNAV